MKGWRTLVAEPAGESLEPFEVEELLASLVEKSLIVADGSGRWRLLESVRDYGRGQLLEAGEAESVCNLHLTHFLAMAEEASLHLSTDDQLAWLAQLDADHDNMRSALDWSIDLPDEGETALRLGAALYRYWDMRSLRTEGRALLSDLLSTPAASRLSGPGATVTYAAAALAWYQGDMAVAQAHTERSLALFAELGDRKGTAGSLNSLGNVYSSRGELAEAARCHEDALTIRRELGDDHGIAASLNNLGTIAMYLGEPLRAREYLEECLALGRKSGNRWSMAIALVNLGEVECHLGRLEQARRYFAECLEKSLELGWPTNPFLLESLASLAIVEGHADRAAALFGAAEHGREIAEVPLTEVERQRLAPRIAALKAEMEDDRYAAAWQRGRAMTLEQAAAEAGLRVERSGCE